MDEIAENHFNLLCLRHSKQSCAMAVGIDLFPGLYCTKYGCSDFDFVFIGLRVLDYCDKPLISPFA